MGQMSMLRGVLFLSCLVVVWHATVEALPVYEDADVVLLDTEKVKAKTSPAAKRAKAEAKNQKAKVVRMRAALNGHSSVDTADKTSLPTSTPSTEDSLNVQAPNLARTSSIAKRKAPLNKPSSEEFVNRALTVGSRDSRISKRRGPFAPQITICTESTKTSARNAQPSTARRVVRWSSKKPPLQQQRLLLTWLLQ